MWPFSGGQKEGTHARAIALERQPLARSLPEAGSGECSGVTSRITPVSPSFTDDSPDPASGSERAASGHFATCSSYSRMTEQNEEAHAVTGHAHLLACELARHRREGRVDRRERVVRLRAVYIENDAPGTLEGWRCQGRGCC